MIRVLFLTRYPYSGASSRYRVFQYLPFLESFGVQAEVQSFMDEEMYRLSFSKGRFGAKLSRTMLAVAKRVFAAWSGRRFDVVVLQRELLPFGPPLLERWLSSRVGLVFDYDDALFIAKPSRFNPLATFFRSPRKTMELFRVADRVLAGNDWLREQAMGMGANAVTLEVAEDVNRFKARDSARNGIDSSRIVVGWLGSTSTVKYLTAIQPALKQIASRFPQVQFKQMGGGDFWMEGVPWERLDWSFEGEVGALLDFDVGLMPLPNEPWALGKSGGKARTYMAAGVVPVCSAIGYNLKLIDHERTGFLCNSESDWVGSLARLIEDTRLRQRMARAARIEVAERFAPQDIARKLAANLHAVADQRRKAV
ncbi:hypothetical protein WM2015_2392 [Wenzhouxiangella marina]|uniref:Glycosyltransferase n=1 Tax=Wenzhouxiangella marina TaxID=1579979 RepID=A0A0K0XYJ0_9GAMM|nr:hypothetical protein WM2015_2392 [Wenzhouxiangella marina]